ncbi:ribosomal protein S18-alanine N-acetyltransferase [Propionivibrio dicarboxylicus]|uniref:[Ribosomal protein bS18]-alanine N-acetyltransferase n=1 Tax=Propionivibrio dicarboxylicus TaxID=83767 RepID=A0A1G8MMG3_9RHOO|nr:ribosomal protein S18-alanine N-acetyltransferase [Propionivibrio dicarboxylicus]SDI69094.1 ribosomal-protein-alanine N-acetyltransferase [Propionivibrio dicarboxylicus]
MMKEFSGAELEVMPMALRDVDDILRIEYSLYSHPWSRANFSDSLDSGYVCCVARIGGELVGYFVVMLAVDEAHLLNISVADAFQGRGLGARLLRVAMNSAYEKGGRFMLLEVRVSNERAFSLYKHFGFEKIGLRRGYYPAGFGREDALVLRRELMSEVCA